MAHFKEEMSYITNRCQDLFPIVANQYGEFCYSFSERPAIAFLEEANLPTHNNDTDNIDDCTKNIVSVFSLYWNRKLI